MAERRRAPDIIAGVKLRSIRRVSIAVVAIGLAVVACGSASDPFASSPAATVRRAFDRLAAHDLLGGSALVCPAQRDPSRPPMIVGGILSPIASVPTGEFAEAFALIELDATDVRVAEVDAREGVVQVPVSGILRLRLDPAEVEVAVRAAAAAQNEAVDEVELRRTLDAIAAGPFELDVGREMEAVRVMKIGDAWLICEPLPSSAPEVPAS